MNTSDSEIVKTNKSGKPWLINCAVCCAAALYLTLFSTMPLTELAGFIVFSVFACLYSALLNSGKTLFCAIVPAVALAGFLCVVFAVPDMSPAELSLCVLNLFFLFACPAVIFFCAVQKASRSVSVAALAVAYVVYALGFIAAVVYESYGSVSLDVLKTAAGDASAAVADMFASVLKSSAAEMYSGGDLHSVIEQFSKSMENTVRTSLPSIIISYCLMLGAVTLLFYGPCMKALKAYGENIGARQWNFSVSGVSVAVFYVCYVLYFVSGLFSTESAFYAAFMNISVILLFPFAYIGMRSVYSVLFVRIKSRIGSAAVIAGAVLAVTFVLGALSLALTLLAFIGASARLREILSDK